MRKIYKLDDEIIFVKGPVNGAIYDFKNKKLSSIDATVCKALDKKRDKEKLNEAEQASLQYLIDSNLLNKDSGFEEYLPPNDIAHELYYGWIELTYSCNLRCIHCYEGQNHINNKNEALTLDEWKDVIDQISEAGCKMLTILGGEPTLYRHAAEVLEYSCTKGFSKIIFYTNSIFINDNIVDVLVKNKEKTQVRFSIYSCESEVHDLITSRKGSYEKMLNTIDKLHALGVELKPMVISMYENQHTVEKSIEFCKSRWGNKPGPSIYLMKKIPDCKQLAHVTTDERILRKVDIARTCLDDFQVNEEVFKRSYYTNNCWHGKFTISEIGDFLLCALSRSVVCGNVKKDRIKNILNTDTLRYHWNFSYNNVAICRDCEFRYACHDCRPDAMSASGDITGKNPYCYYDPYKGIWS